MTLQGQMTIATPGQKRLLDLAMQVRADEARGLITAQEATRRVLEVGKP